jgi:hypothetical protein
MIISETYFFPLRKENRQEISELEIIYLLTFYRTVNSSQY